MGSEIHLFTSHEISAFEILIMLSCDTNHFYLCRWKEWSADRFMRYWGHFLEKPTAREDPQHDLIKQLYEQVKGKADQQKPQPQATNGSANKQKKAKKSSS